jgi:hypothetical protein
LVVTEQGREEKHNAPSDGDFSAILNEYRAKGVAVESISVLRPSLLEIFLEKVGEDDEGA